MRDMFDARSARPMLIGAISPPFDDADSLFELKLDGDRCLAWLNGRETVLQSRRGTDLLPRLPELAGIHRQVAARCILDGEVVVGLGRKADFERLRSRMAQKSPARVALGAARSPAIFVVFDIIYHGDGPVIGLPLWRRKQLLAGTVADSERMSLARTVDKAGKAFYGLALRQGLEGVVGKKKGSLYTPGKRTREWVKVKNLLEDDYVVCGYVLAAHVAMLLLGQYNEAGGLVYRGRTTLGLRTADFARIRAVPRAARPPYDEPPPGVEPSAVWLRPALVCTVAYTQRPPGGLMRQPRYLRLRPDKSPREAIMAVPG